MNESGLNHMGFKTASAFLEYILNSEGEIMWMHFDEANRIESDAKEESWSEGYNLGIQAAFGMVKSNIERLENNFTNNEQ
jgi:hypothetical protein